MKNKTNSSLSLRKVVLSAMVAAPLATLPSPLWALPGVTGTTASATATNMTSSAGNATIVTPVGTTLNISTPDRTVLKWVEFGSGVNLINAGDTVIYNLPSSSSSVLNMVTGANPTTIDGTLSSNGKILVLNQNGITVSGTGVINASGVSLSTRPETEFYYLANGDLAYNGTPTTDISVAGKISVGSSGNVLLSARNVAVTGNIDAGVLTINAGSSSAGGTVTLGGAADVTIGNATGKYGVLNVTTNGGNLDVTNGAANVIVAGGNATLTTTGTAGNGTITQGGAGAFKVGTGSADSTLTINAGSGAVTLAKVNDNAGGKTLNVNVTAGVTSITSDVDKMAVTANTKDLTLQSAGDLTLNASTVNGALSLTSTAGSVASGGNVTVKTGSAITLSAATAGKSITLAGLGNLTFATITSNATGTVTLTSSGDVPLPAITTQTLAVTSGGNITQTGDLAISGTSTVNAAGAITLTSVTNALGNVVIKAAPNGAKITDADGFTVNGGTAATGDVTLVANGAGAIILGAASADAISIGGNLTITTANSDITQGSDNTVVNGLVKLTAGTGNIVLDGSAGKSVGLNNQYGQINVVSANNVTLFEQSGLNLGTITAGGNLLAYSSTAIVNSGVLTVTGTTTVGAGTATAPGPIALDYINAAGTASNQLGGGITILDDINLLSGTASTLSSSVGNLLASSVAVVNSANIANFTLGTNIYGTSSAAPVSLKTIGTGTITAGALNTTGAVTLTSNTGSITATNGSNTFTNVSVVSNGGAVSVSSTKDLTVNETLTSSDALNPNPVVTAAFSSSGNIVLGSLTSVYNGTNSFTAGSKKTVTDSVAGIAIYGPVSFTAQSGVTVSKVGHNFGGITIDTSGNNGNVSLVESGTLKIDAIKAGKGNVTLTSSNQSIIEPDAGNGIVTSGNVTLNASNGYVSLLRASKNAVTGTLGLTATGNSTIMQNTANALKLGTVTVSNGTLTVDATGTAADLTQVGAINVYGDTTIKGDATKSVVLTNNNNQFGGLIVSGGNVAITEATTLNVKSIQTAGTVALTSVNGDIVDSTDSTVTNNGISAGAGAAGAATFTAANVTLDNAANVFSSVAFTTTGNATVVQPTGDLALGASTVGGALTVTTQQAGKSISQSGALNVSGNATFNTNAGALTLSNTANQFGPVRFVTGLTSVITENTTFNLNSGTVATAPVVINTNGNFLTSGTGGSSFTNDLTINAIGTIIPAPSSLLVTGTFTVFSNNTKDLSGLSKSGNLAGKDPVNQGTGTYVPPSP